MNPELMVAIFWIAQKPEWEVWITTGIEGSPTGRRGPDVLPSVALECVTIERLTASRTNSAGIPRPADLSWITMAEWLCGTSDRHVAPRVPGPNGHLQRGAPAANSFRLCDVLQSSAHALGITERCPLASSRPTIWRHCRHSDLGWAASPIRPDMIFGKDRCPRPLSGLNLIVAVCPFSACQKRKSRAALKWL
jgi:hypothetical protein